jgi:hypothetical protein
MRRLIATLLLVCAPILSQSRDDKWRQDLQFIATSLPKTHPNLFAQMTQADFNQAVVRLNHTIPSKADYEIVVEMARIVAMAGDGHTSLDLRQNRAAFRSYPLRLYWFDDGLYAIAGASSNFGALGKRLVEIGNTPIDQAYALVSTVLSHENDQWVRFQSPDYLVMPEVLYALRIVPDLDKASFVFEDSDGSRFTLDLAATPRGDTASWLAVPHNARPSTPLYRQNSALWYWFDYLPDSKTLYIKCDVCASSPTLPFGDFLSRLGDFLNSHSDINTYVLDVRNNTGGNNLVILPLVQALQDGVAQGALTASQVFVIIGRQTFSAGMNAAIQFKSLGVTLVGEPSGGKPNFFGSPTSLQLPNSALQVSCSTATVRNTGFDGPTLVPDIPVRLTASDYLAERDPALATILAH